MRKLGACGLVGLGLLLVACSSGGGASPVAASVPDTVSSTVLSTTVIEPTTTQAPTTTVAPATTTIAPTTTLSVEDEIRQAVQDYFTGYSTCLRDPAACRVSTFLTATGPAARFMDDAVAAMVDRGLHVDQDLHGSYISTRSVEWESPSKVVTVDCWFDAAVVLGPPGPDGVATVVNDVVVSTLYRHVILLQDGRWLVDQTDKLEELGGDDQCGGA